MTTSTYEMKQLVDSVMQARTYKDTERLIDLARRVYGGIGWRPVGGKENNAGHINIGSDPLLALVERLTNQVDALLELYQRLNPSVVPNSPREAARLLAGVPTGGLAEMTEMERRALGSRARVELLDSGNKKRPSVLTHDNGIGVAPERFSSTIVSLSESNKLGKHYLMGTYGQGGSVTFGFCRATVLVSRRHPSLLDGASNAIGWTVVKEDLQPGWKQPSYQYLTDEAGDVLSIDAALLPNLAPGTRITHIEYELRPLSWFSLWQELNAALFDPVLPIEFRGRPSAKSDRVESRIITGNAMRLNNPQRARGDVDIVHTDSFRYNLGGGLGAITYNYWVVDRGDSSWDPTAAESYVSSSTAVTVTLHGQRQDSQPRRWIKDKALLPYLWKNMIVQIDVSDLSIEAKRLLFASTRERARESEIRDRIYSVLADWLKEDDTLSSLNHSAKEQLLKRASSKARSRVRTLLSKLIKQREREIAKRGHGGYRGKGKASHKSGPGTPARARNIDDSHLPNVPTHLRFESDRIIVRRAARGYTWVSINAKNGYLPEHEDDLTLTITAPESGSEGQVRVAMKSKLLGGKARWVLEAGVEASIGEYKLEAMLITPTGVLSDSIPVVVKDPKPAEPGPTRGAEPDVALNIEWVEREQWPDYDFVPNTVGVVYEDEESVDIYINRDYERLESYFSSRSLTEETLKTRADRYQTVVAYGLWLLDRQVKQLSADEQPSDPQLQAEKARLAEVTMISITPDEELVVEDE